MNQRKLNLLHTSLDLDFGGLQRLIADMTLAMDHQRYNIEILCFDELGSFADQLLDAGMKVTLLQKNQESFDFSYFFKLAAYLREKKIDILHMHTGTFFFGSIAARLASTPASLYTEHGRFFVEPLVRLIEDRISALFVNQIIAVSSELEQYLSEIVKLPKRKICTIINGIKTDNFAPRDKPKYLLEEFKLTASNKILGSVGRLDDVKDQLSMIEAFALVIKEIPEARLVLVGDGPMRDELKKSIDNHHLNDKVFLPGSRKDIADLLNLFDIFLLTSVSEGTSISLLEAMASGLPAVVTNVGGNPSIVEDNSNGLIVEPKDIEQIANNIISLLNDDDKMKTFGINAVTMIRDNYSIEKMIDKYEDLYFRLLKKKKQFRNLSR